MSLILRLIGLCGLLLAAQSAQAACAVSATGSADLGTRTSYDIRAGGLAAVSIPPTLNCTGGPLLSITSTDYVSASAASSNGFRLRSAAGDMIGYRLSADPAGTFAYTQTNTMNYLADTLIGLLGVLGNSTLAPPMYAAINDMANVPAGTYADTVTVNWSWAICRGVGLGGICILREQNSGSVTLTVSVTVTKDCRIIAPTVSFGSAPLASRFPSVTQAVAIDCTRGSTFTVAFSAGTSGTSRPWRQMKDGSGHVLRYNLYWPDGTTIWDASSPRAGSSAGTGSTTPTLLQTYVAKVDASQSTPPVGSYSDTVSVIVSF